MLMTRYDAAGADQEWQSFLCEQDFGQLIAPGRGSDLPVVVPVHYIYDPKQGLELHLHRKNPIWEVLDDTAHALFAVIDAHVYIPSLWNANPGTPVEWAAPTSYYAAVQVTGPITILDDPAKITDVLRRQMQRMQPEGGYAPIEPGPNPFGRMLRAIRAVRLEVAEVRAKFKFGGNKRYEHQSTIADRLADRGSPADLRARTHVLRRRDPAAYNENDAAFDNTHPHQNLCQ